jgi:ubiquinone/menaquinone biosynthesis C-methylase UbiE
MTPKQLAKRFLQNSSIRNAVRMCVYFPVDVLETVTRQKPRLVPPRGMRYNNTKTYLHCAKKGLAQTIEACGIQPHHKVLDVGCGSGSVALPLLNYLSQGTYDGFDIVPSWVSWCQKNITAANSRFRFKFVNVYSKHYNSAGTITSETLKFPYEDDVFDCVMLFSIFTHMRLAGISNYITEIARVLKPGGHAFITTCLLNDESRKAIADGRSSLRFPYSFEGCLVVDEVFPETAIAVPQKEIVDWLAQAGLRLKDIKYGSWASRPASQNLHDNLVVQKL